MHVHLLDVDATAVFINGIPYTRDEFVATYVVKYMTLRSCLRQLCV